MNGIVAHITPTDPLTGEYPINSQHNPILRRERRDLCVWLQDKMPMTNQDGSPQTSRVWNKRVFEKLKGLRDEHQRMGGHNTKVVKMIRLHNKVLVEKSVTEPVFQETARARGAFNFPLDMDKEKSFAKKHTSFVTPTAEIPSFGFHAAAFPADNTPAAAPPPIGGHATAAPASSPHAASATAFSPHAEADPYVNARAAATPTAHAKAASVAASVLSEEESRAQNMVKNVVKATGASKLRTKTTKLSSKAATMPGETYEAAVVMQRHKLANAWNTINGDTDKSVFKPFPTTEFLQNITDGTIIEAFLESSKTKQASFTYASLKDVLQWSNIGTDDEKRVTADFKRRMKASGAFKDAQVKGKELLARRQEAAVAAKLAKASAKAANQEARQKRGQRATATKGEHIRREATRFAEEYDLEDKEEDERDSKEVVQGGRAMAMKEYKLEGVSAKVASNHTRRLLMALEGCTHTVWGEKPSFKWSHNDMSTNQAFDTHNIRIGAVCEVQFDVENVSNPYVGILIGVRVPLASEDTDTKMVVEFAHFMNDFEYVVLSTSLMAEKIRFFPSVYMDSEYVLRNEADDEVVSKKDFVESSGEAHKETIYGQWAKEGGAVCTVCKHANGEGDMLLCDNCDHGCHFACMSPCILVAPEGDWHCSNCAPVAQTTSA